MNNNTSSNQKNDSSETTENTEITEEPNIPENPVLPESGWNADGVLRILTIGNSFSDDTMEYVYQIAKSAGVDKIELGNLYIGGCSLLTHATNAQNDSAAYEYRTNIVGKWATVKNYKMSDAIKSKNWDFISMQQVSGMSGVESSYKDLDYLIKYVKDLADPATTLVWNMTWAYQQNSGHSDFQKYEKNQMKMYQSILSCVEGCIDKKEDIKIISPTGTAIQNARTSYVGDHLTRDGFHLTYDLGRFTAGLTFFHALTEVSIENLDFAPSGVADDLKKIAIESAINAVKNPRAVTNSVYTNTAPTDELNEE